MSLTRTLEEEEWLAAVVPCCGTFAPRYDRTGSRSSLMKTSGSQINPDGTNPLSGRPRVRSSADRPRRAGRRHRSVHLNSVLTRASRLTAGSGRGRRRFMHRARPSHVPGPVPTSGRRWRDRAPNRSACSVNRLGGLPGEARCRYFESAFVPWKVETGPSSDSRVLAGLSARRSVATRGLEGRCRFVRKAPRPCRSRELPRTPNAPHRFSATQ
jgi:hypothetical protein